MISQRARDQHFSSVVVDTHSDSLVWTIDEDEDLAADLVHRQLTLPKMRAGGVSAQFFAGWADPARFSPEAYVRRTLEFIDAMYRVCEAHPDEIELARTASDIRRLKAAGKLAAVLCVEGGHSIDDNLAVLRVYHQLGVRYMTLTWNNTNNWADGILDESRHDGLTGFGGDVIREMNRLGIIVDISHASVKTFWDAMETTSKPIMASHSSSIEICAHPRNMNDDQLRAVAQSGGVVSATFVPQFVSEPLRLQLEELGLSGTTANTEQEARFREIAGELALPSYTEIVDHIDRMVGIAGIDHVGLGADFGVLVSTPVGMEDCSKFPWLTEDLLRRGYSDEDVRKILGENVLRVMEAVIGE
jgi:membrane dipeptidase